MPHALGARYGMFFSCRYAQVSGHETHGRASGLDIYFIRHVLQRGDHYSRIITITQVIRQHFPASQSVNHQRTVTDALGGGQANNALQAWGSRKRISHRLFLQLNGQVYYAHGLVRRTGSPGFVLLGARHQWAIVKHLSYPIGLVLGKILTILSRHRWADPAHRGAHRPHRHLAPGRAGVRAGHRLQIRL